MYNETENLLNENQYEIPDFYDLRQNLGPLSSAETSQTAMHLAGFKLGSRRDSNQGFKQDFKQELHIWNKHRNHKQELYFWNKHRDHKLELNFWNKQQKRKQ
ncbi:hypothetical protein [Neobacillus cucumis]|uniref:hypothetical protein n=1 Tax=Neobacillus cucumis TaxID=1740721 RepID=UPI002E2415C3|nr:hypothetical protein [Neobacillus cucumis]